MPDEAAKSKWNQKYRDVDDASSRPAYVLEKYQYLLPNNGVALDIACGLGGNAVFLAQHGLDTHAWDISEQAIQKLVQVCKKNNIKLITEIRDVCESPPVQDSFDVICLSYFLERSITEKIISALRPSGLLFYQTFIVESVTDYGPSNLNYRLQQNELLKLFSPLHILIYQELGRVGDINKGIRDTALLVAQKR